MEIYSDEIADGLESPNSASTTSIHGDYVKLVNNLADSTCRTTSSSSVGSNASESLKPTKDVSEAGALRLDDIRFVQRLGSGDIGTVYLVELKGHTGHLFAAKVMCKEELASRNKEGRAGVEKEILEMLDHPFLPSLYATLESPRWSCLLTEFCPGGDLHILRQRQPERRFDEDAVRFYASEVVAALEYLHMLGIVYRDLKPENVLVRADGHIMLTDFDLSLKCNNSTSSAHIVYDDQPRSRRSHPSPYNPSTKFSMSSCILPRCVIPHVPSCFHPSRKKRRPTNIGRPKVVAEPIEARSMSFVGTHEYLAPEIVTGEGHGNGVDWWTLGIFIYELLYGVTPFRGRDNEFTLSNIVARGLEFPKEPIVSGSFKKLISELLNKNPSKRMGSMMGATAIKHHPFFEGVNWSLLRCTKPPYVPDPFKLRDLDVTCDDDDDQVDADVDYF